MRTATKTIGAGRAPTSLITLLDREVDRLDRLMGELRGGLRDQRQFDDIEERAQAVSAGIVAAFRGGAQTRRVE